MKKSLAGVLMGIAYMTSAAVMAEDTPSPYGAILATGVLTNHTRDPDFGIGGQGIIGIPLNKWVTLEATVLGNILRPNELDRAGNNNDYQIGGGLDLLFPFGEGKIRPFIVAGGGGLYEKIARSPISTSGQYSPYLNAGAGVLWGLTDQLSVRVEGRAFGDFNEKAYPGEDILVDGRFSIGLQYAFHAPKQALPPPPPPPVAPPPPPPPPADSDGDGVPDSRDECPNTPAGVKVDARGCPLDSDGDGVPDYLDQCPGTPKGFKVDAVGCIIEQTVILRTVNFEFNKDTLTTEAKDALDLVAAGLASQPKLSVQIDGHTDSVGSDAYNLRLSKKRAESVRTYLIGKGVDAARLGAEGYGESKPIASNETETGRAENRRVEFQVLNKPLAVKVIKKGPTATKPRTK